MAKIPFLKTQPIRVLVCMAYDINEEVIYFWLRFTLYYFNRRVSPESMQYRAEFNLPLIVCTLLHIQIDMSYISWLTLSSNELYWTISPSICEHFRPFESICTSESIRVSKSSSPPLIVTEDSVRNQWTLSEDSVRTEWELSDDSNDILRPYNSVIAFGLKNTFKK